MALVGSVEEAAFVQNSDEYLQRSLTSARNLLPHVIDLICPRSVVDFGCGGGAWLCVCRELGVSNILGIDGSYVDRRKLLFPEEKFLAHDLREPLKINKVFDLAISLEVAEHISANKVDVFIDSLTRLSPIILFSAAIPFQGGVGHVNEQWPSYWCKIFAEKGYSVVDVIRRSVWDNVAVDTWYKQNTLLFAETSFIKKYPKLSSAHELVKTLPIDLVHPNRYLAEADPKNINPHKVPLAAAYEALKFQLRRKLRSKLHWRIQRLLED